MIYSFTPAGGTEFILPPATEFAYKGAVRRQTLTVLGARGGIDLFGDESPLDLQELEFPFSVLCPTQAKIDAVRALFVKRGVLRVLQEDRTLRQAYFKKITLDDGRSASKLGHTDFVCSGILWPLWRSVTQRSASRTGTSFSVTNAGNAPAGGSLSIVLSGHASQVTAVTLTNTTAAHALTWTGATPLAVGQKLKIDCAAYTVQRLSSLDVFVADEWPQVTLGATQIALMELAGGANAFTVSSLPASSTWAFTYRDTWY